MVPNAEGKRASLAIYAHLAAKHGGKLTPAAATEGIQLYGQYVQEAAGALLERLAWEQRANGGVRGMASRPRNLGRQQPGRRRQLLYVCPAARRARSRAPPRTLVTPCAQMSPAATPTSTCSSRWWSRG